MTRRITPSQLQSMIRQAEAKQKRAIDDYNRKAKQHNDAVVRQIRQANAEVDRVNRENARRIDSYNRQVDSRNRQIESHNRKLISEINRQLRSASTIGARYTEPERALVDRVYAAVGQLDPREYDTFLSYARIDGADVAGALREALETLGVSVWFDEVAIKPGRSQSLQMDAGLQKARSGIALLTPAYLTGRFWTERELGALLSKNILIPVLHNVTFDDVKNYSGILPDLAGFTTAHDSIDDIAKKIAAAVIIEEEQEDA